MSSSDSALSSGHSDVESLDEDSSVGSDEDITNASDETSWLQETVDLANDPEGLNEQANVSSKQTDSEEINDHEEEKEQNSKENSKQTNPDESLENNDHDKENEQKSNENSEQTDSDESLQIPETESEGGEEEVKKVANPRIFKRIVLVSDSDDSSDDEEKLRKSIYQAESDDEDHQPPIEEKAYSKATRRSIDGFAPRKSVVQKSDESSDDESDELIVEDDETMDLKENVESFQLEVPPLSSTIRTPLRDISGNNRSSLSHESFNTSIGTKMSSTISTKDGSDLLDEATGGVSIEKIKVSLSQYNAEVATKEKLECQINTMMKGLEMAKTLPDGGEKLKIRINTLLEAIDQKSQLLQSWEVDENKSIKKEIAKSFQSDYEDKSSVSVEDCVIIAAYNKVDDVKPQFLGKVGMKKFTTQKALTVEKLQDIQESIEARPAETELGKPPKHLKLTLMNHQLHAIRFMMWREKQSPRGGILADDMGLGKTMTTISLILKGLQADEESEEESGSDEDNSRDEDWKARGRKDLRDGGTLVVCPASLLKQWEAEIQNKVKRGAIEHYVFHGANREYKPRYLAKYDVVLTTYQLVVTEEKNNGCLFQVKWNRIVLDEGHVIRNHKSKQSEAICKLMGKFRWVLTGTPIHNKEFDLYAAIKFLRCKPFDDLQYWKNWIEIKGRDSSPRVQALLRAIMLRRTKQGLIESGEIQSLPEKVYKEFHVKLNKEERLVYNRFMSFSKAVFATYVDQQQVKHNNFVYDKHNLGRLYQQFSNRFNANNEIKAHEILTLLLRMRQICCHPGLAKANLEAVDAAAEIQGADNECADNNESDGGILQKLENLTLNDSNDNDREIDRQITGDHEVFNMDMPSSKIIQMMDVLRNHVMNSDDKAIIVSQWTSYLRIIREMLEVEGVTYCELNGTIPVKDRNDIVVKFNKSNSGVKVMLLSLTAGGVGLNLVGANYLFLMDLHWNPQLEQQAQDRIYRFGQQKQVNVFKFICENTIEESILNIQRSKLETATASLTGAKKTAGSKLTMDDLKLLFGMTDV